jgi:Domain of unknown function (DUF4349)
MSEASFDMVLQELRDTAPRAPEGLRERIAAFPAAQARRSIRPRPALAAAIALAIAVGLGAAVIGGVTGSKSPEPVAVGEFRSARSQLNGSERNPTRELPGIRDQQRAYAPGAPGGVTLAPSLTAKSRLQQQQVSMRLRVENLSRATQKAVRQTRNLGGFLAAANYSTGESAGDSSLDLRVPAQNLQKAIANFTDLGTILAQQIRVADLQGGYDRLGARIAAKEKLIKTLTGEQLAEEQRALRRLRRQRDALVRESTYAKVSLHLTTRKQAEKQEAPGRFESFWGDASDILGKEAIGVLYALVIVGPFAILAALAFFAERARRRRADHRLLEETG